MAKHTLSVVVEDVPGVLTRVSSLFARRAFNIHSLAVGPTQAAGQSRITVVVDADEKSLEQVTKQLHKLINVLKVVELVPENSVQRDHMMIKVKADVTNRTQVTQAAELFRGHIVDVAPDSLTIEATGTSEKLGALLAILEPFGVREYVQSGLLAIARGPKSTPEKTRTDR
ncbi:acetolactate synthase small subunit [Falsarthrobacter nasiphocae]|uniref:Acetolactate synthase small subunit n=1 Tax=Falsarthrobacter nasiphocae TaxID=189863 RepID=A0AAE3YGJ8_9MICC|nr:acetolactate synthase small subunit [Falsarthrobacter nasiphocae]MDR6892815.1 acetolactate synthase-1/3 small subunit [Falsarthrobacter nasiphocae]